MQSDATSSTKIVPELSICAALTTKSVMNHDTAKMVKLMQKAERCTSRKKAKKILKKASKLTPTQLPPRS